MFSNNDRFKRISDIQKNPEKIRNISVIAHVDHGKTTLTDCLLSSNNIISKKLIGKLRYMDSRKDEQERLITMKSSSISLVFDQSENDSFIINLIDSPGHIEFSSEVSSALRNTDGALILVDVVDGISSQTLTVLKQAYDERVNCVLVLNKMDRLITELKVTPYEAFRQISMIIEQINAIQSSYMRGGNDQEADFKKEEEEEETKKEFDINEEIDLLESKYYFSPENGNIIFSSAVDCWAFTLEQFAQIWGKRLGCNPEKLQKMLWGEFYFNSKTKKFSKKPFSSKSQPMFVDMVLTSIWQVYDKIMSDDQEAINRIATSFGLNLAKEVPNNDKKSKLMLIMNRWLPLDRIILGSVINLLPSPVDSQKLRLPILCPKLDQLMKSEFQDLKQSLVTCNSSSSAPVIIYISKMVLVHGDFINERGLAKNSKEQKMIGFARIFSGRLRRGDSVFVITHKKEVSEEMLKMKKDIQQVKIDHVYLFMGQYLEGIEEVSAGTVFGIGSLDNIVYKTATISSSMICPSINQMKLKNRPLLRVALNTELIEDYPKLIDGLKKLNKADPAVEIWAQDNGDVVLSTCGEVHLSRCITDLEETFANVKIKISEPIVTFRETIISSNMRDKKVKKQNEQSQKSNHSSDSETSKPEEKKADPSNEDPYNDSDDLGYIVDEEEEDTTTRRYIKKVDMKKLDKKNKGKTFSKVNIVDLKSRDNTFEALTPNSKFKIRVRAVGLKFELALWIEKQLNVVRKVVGMLDKEKVSQEAYSFAEEFEGMLNVNVPDKGLRDVIKKNLVAFGPKGVGPNLLCIRGVESEHSFLYKLKNKPKCNSEPWPNNEEEEKINSGNIEKASSSKNSSLTQKQSGISTLSQEIIEALYKISNKEIYSSMISGFEFATNSGPLCEEPLFGVCFIVESFEAVSDFDIEKKELMNSPAKELASTQDESGNSKDNSLFSEKTIKMLKADTYGPLTGQIMSTMKEACLESFLGAGPRLVEGVYKCHMQTDSEFYGKAYEILNKRRATIVEESLNENSNIFTIVSHLPLQESIGFYVELLGYTSGRVSAQLLFDGWRIISENPFYTPKTLEEIEEFGSEILTENFAKTLIDKIRKRKGIFTTEKIVVAAEKQRNLSKKK